MKRNLLIGLSFFLASTFVFAQDRVISGTVTSAEDGIPLPGVNVVLKGTTNGAVTNGDGVYQISVPGPGGILVFSFIGFVTSEVEIGDKTNLDIQLSEDATQLNEVVVVGYSSTTQQAFTGTAKVVSSDNILRKNVPNVSRALMGEIAGVQVLNTTGQPGATATVRIRGFGSANGNRDPLYVVDGVPFFGGINSINPNDIESTVVLKDAAATAIYGTRGANGVILINTKSGKGTGSFVEADVQMGSNFSGLPRYSIITSPEQYAALGWEGLYNQRTILNNADTNPANDQDPTTFANANLFGTTRGIAPSYNMWLFNGSAATAAQLIDPTTKSFKTDANITRKYTPENWRDYAFHASVRKQADITFGGSNDKTSYYTSIGYLGDNGYSINSSFERMSGRFNINHNAFKWLHTNMNVGFVRTKTNNNGQSNDSGSIFWFVDNIPPVYPLFLKDQTTGANVPDPIFGGNQFDYGGAYSRGFGLQTNSVGDGTYNISRTIRSEVNGSASLNIDIMPGLTLENRLGFQYYNNKYLFRGNKFYGNSASSKGIIQYDLSELLTYNVLNLLRYNKEFGSHNLEVLVAHEATDWSTQFLGDWKTGLADPNILEFNNAVVPTPAYSYTNSYSLESFFGQLNYDYNKTYFLSGSLRRDGSSRFPNDKWGTFGSVGAGWLISNASFMKSQKIFSSLKLRASYGVMGDQGSNLYPAFDVFDISNLNDKVSLSFNTKGNPNLTWETSKMTEVGLEFDLGKYLTGSLDVYQKNTSNLFFNRAVGPSAGYPSITVNDGSLRNQGFEFDLTGHILKTTDYFLDLGVNGDVFKNKFTRMPIDPATGEQKVIQVTGNYGWSVGHSLYDYYTRQSAGVDPDDGAAIWTVYYDDKNGNGVVDTGEAVANLTDYLSKNSLTEGDLKKTTTKTYGTGTLMYTGKSAIPKLKGAVNLRGGYKGITLSVQMLYSLGGYGYDALYQGLMSSGRIGGNNWSTDILGRWQNPGDVSTIPALANNQRASQNGTSDRFIIKSNFLLLNNVRLGYDFPSSLLSKIKVKSASIWISGDNLAVLSKRKGYNPFISQDGSNSTYNYAPLSTVSGGIKVRF